MSGILLNRMDAGLLVLPAFLVAAWRRPFTARVLAAALGVVPFIAWEVFSVVYYGFLFPNTAYAKLATGVSSWSLLLQGGHYFANSLQWDTVTLVTVMAGLGATLHPSMKHLRPLALGIGLYLLYILRIGGDFMFGRFFAAPFFMALMILAQAPWLESWSATCRDAPHGRARAQCRPDEWGGVGMDHGITDQRLLFSESTRYITQDDSPFEERASAVRGIELRRKGRQVVEMGMIGMTGYLAGPDVHIVDFFALADPLLARRPADPQSRIGHFRRRIPEGYVDSIRHRTNRLRSPRLARYYDDLVVITQGPLWTWERWRAIARLNFVQRTT